MMSTTDGAAGSGGVSSGELTSWETGGRRPVVGAGVPASPVRRRRLRRLVLGSAGVVVLLLIGLVALAPTIGSWLAPGLIEGAVNPGIKGKVKVARASIGWFSGLAAGPVEVVDPNGVTVARAEINAPVTLWQAVSGRYWSARSLDLGTVTVSGKADVAQYNDGSTNLERALAPTDAAKPKKPAAGGGGQPLPAIKATLKVTQFDATVRNEKDKFQSEIGLKGLAGEANIDADLDAPGGGAIKAVADFSGNATGGGSGDAKGAAPVTLKLDADVKQNSTGQWTPESIDRARVKLGLSNAPIGVVDALAGMGGALVQAIGDRADVSVDVDGNMQNMGGAVRLVSAGLNADANLAIKDGMLTGSGEKGTRVALRSAEFLQSLPQTREGVAKAAEKVKLTQAPSVEVTLESLRMPVTKGAAAFDPATLDFRGASLGMRVKVSGMSGQVFIPDIGDIGTGTGPIKGAWKPFAVEPVELAIHIPDLTKPVSISTGTKATLDGKPAGDISVAINADGLLDDKGRLRAAIPGGKAGYANKADAAVRIAGMSTALAQPLVAGVFAGLPVDLTQDVGATLDMNLTAKADVAAVTDAAALASGGLASFPPADITATVDSSNIKANVNARLEKAVLTTKGEGIKVTVASTTPLAQRILRASRHTQMNDPRRDPKAALPPEITLTGAGKVELTARDVTLSLKDTSPGAVIAAGKAAASMVISDLNAAVDMGGSKSPVRIERYAVTTTLAPGSAPKVDIDGRFAHENQPFTITGGYTLDGLKNGLPRSKGPGALAEINPNGATEIKGLPRSLLGIVPAGAAYASEVGASAAADAMTRAIGALVRETLGPTMDVGVQMASAAAKGGGQSINVKLTTAGAGGGKGATVDLGARVSATEAEVSSLAARLPLDPRAVNPVLAAAGAPKPGAQPTSAPPGPHAPPMTLGAPVAVNLTIDKAAVIPLLTDAAGAVTPDWAHAGEVNIKASADGDVVVENIAMGGGGGGKNADGQDEPLRLAKAALRQFAADIRAPLAGVPVEGRATNRASIKLGATVLNRTSGEAQVAKLVADATALMNGESPDVTAKLSEISSAALENLLGQKDLIVGAIGDSAEATLRVTPGGGPGVANTGGTIVGQVIGVVAEMTSPRVSGAKISLAKDDAHVWITQPSTITWTPNKAFINKYLLGGEDAPAGAPAAPAQGGGKRGQRKAAPGGAEQPASLTLDEAQPITVNITKLAAAVGGPVDAAGKPVTGPLKPGVFELDLSARAPSLSMNVAPTQAGQAATKVVVEGLTINATSARAAGPGAVEVNLGIDRVTGAGARTDKRSTAKINISNIADAQGAVTSERAVVNADVDVAAFPTPIVDNLANQHGLLTEWLGPTVSLVARAKNLSKGVGPAGGSGDLNVEATSPRATAKIKGDVKDGRFAQNGPTSIEMREIHYKLDTAIAGLLPMVGELDKVPSDEPATVIAEGLTAPLDDDMRKLNGKITVNMGVAKFSTQAGLSKFLKEAGGRDAGSIGKKIQPFVVTIDKGVATYERFKLPVGEFSLETRGTVDLVQKQVDVITYVPLFALTEEAVGNFTQGAVSKVLGLDKATGMPFRTRGPIGQEKTLPDVELFVKETLSHITKDPGKILGDVLGDVLKKGKK